MSLIRHASDHESTVNDYFPETDLRRPGEISAPDSFLMSFVNQAPKLVGVKAKPVAGDRKSRALPGSFGSCRYHSYMIKCVTQ